MDEFSTLDGLLAVCPTRLLRGRRPCGPVLPPGACRLVPGPALRIEGLPTLLPVLGATADRPTAWRLAGPDGEWVLELLPDTCRRPPGEMGPREQRRHYDRLLAHLLRSRPSLAGSLETLSSARDPLMRFSGGHCRLVFRGGRTRRAGLALYPFQSESGGAGFLTAALSWYHHCHQRRRRFDRILVLLVPRPAALRLMGALALLDPRRVHPRLVGYDLTDMSLEVLDLERLRSTYSRDVHFEYIPARPLHHNPAVDELLARHDGRLRLEKTPHATDMVTFHGLPLVHITGSGPEELQVGHTPPYTPWQRWPADRLDRWLADVMAIRRCPSPRPLHPVYRLFPERWLESLLLTHIRRLLPSLQPQWTYRQVPTWRGSGRAVMDVLSLTGSNRLVVVEIKAAECGSLLFQALDYWERVMEGARSGAFQRCGYFMDIRLAPEPPMLTLVVPMFRTHKHLRLLAGYLSPQIPVRLVEVDMQWRRRFRVVRRTRLTSPGD